MDVQESAVQSALTDSPARGRANALRAGPRGHALRDGAGWLRQGGGARIGNPGDLPEAEGVRSASASGERPLHCAAAERSKVVALVRGARSCAPLRRCRRQRCGSRCTSRSARAGAMSRATIRRTSTSHPSWPSSISASTGRGARRIGKGVCYRNDVALCTSACRAGPPSPQLLHTSSRPGPAARPWNPERPRAPRLRSPARLGREKTTPATPRPHPAPLWATPGGAATAGGPRRGRETGLRAPPALTRRPAMRGDCAEAGTERRAQCLGAPSLPAPRHSRRCPPPPSLGVP